MMKKFYVKLMKLAVISAAIFILIFSGVFWELQVFIITAIRKALFTSIVPYKGQMPVNLKYWYLVVLI